ncbi:hypothetical protein C8R43DRAFT_982473 [Mycena crocata]|nr:hypothetical protein C8R43DRAFT_982473 [Mycena crocata]
MPNQALAAHMRLPPYRRPNIPTSFKHDPTSPQCRIMAACIAHGWSIPMLPGMIRPRRPKFPSYADKASCARFRLRKCRSSASTLGNHSIAIPIRRVAHQQPSMPPIKAVQVIFSAHSERVFASPSPEPMPVDGHYIHFRTHSDSRGRRPMIFDSS